MTALAWLSCLSLMSEAREHRRLVPPQLILAIAYVESRCGIHEEHVSSGALGIMQVMPFWTKSNLRARCGANLRRARVNLCYGTHILRHYLARCRGNLNCALARYSGNAPGYAAKVRRALKALK